MGERTVHRRNAGEELARKAAVERADAWTLAQSARLATSPAVILDAIKRGWLPEQVENISSKYALEDAPPAHVCFTVIGESKVRCIPRHPPAHGWQGDPAERQSNRSRDGENVMALAFMRAGTL